MMNSVRANPAHDYDLVYPRLYVGGAPKTLPKDFDVVVLAATQFQPNFGDPKDTLLIYAPFEDAIPTQRDVKLIQTTAGQVAGFVAQKKRVLVTCWAGLNRSGLIAVLAMGQLGVPKTEAIARLRLARGPDALHNPHFLALIGGDK